jgi:hypothetical protein
VIFRREPIHKKLAREAELESETEREAARARAEVEQPGPRWGLTGADGIPRPRRWDAVAPAEAPGIGGDEVNFLALPNGDLLVDEDEPDDSLAPLVEAVEQRLKPPYRAEAVRREGETWAVAARRVQLATFDAQGAEVELSSVGDERTLTVDGQQVFGSVRELERLGEEQGRQYVVRARRLEGRLWEVEADPL